MLSTTRTTSGDERLTIVLPKGFDQSDIQLIQAALITAIKSIAMDESIFGKKIPEIYSLSELLKATLILEDSD